jgi:hypothetical protein
MRADLLTRYGLRVPDPQGYPYVPGQEAVGDLVQSFNQWSPNDYTTDPATGKTIVTKEMPKPFGPEYLDSPYQNLFRSPNNPNWNMNNPTLRTSYILPVGAMTDPKFVDRTAPTSDAARQGAELAGVGNVGAATSTLNPLTHWPESVFKVPLREPNLADPYASPEPVFGGTIDFSRGKYNLPPTPGQWSSPFGNLEGMSVPGWGSSMIPPVQSTDYEQRIRQNLLRRSTSI